MNADKATLREIKKIKVIGLIMWVAAPPVYLLIGIFTVPPIQRGGQIDMMLYIMLIIALVSPLLLPLIENHQIRKYHLTPQSNASPAQYLVAVYIIRYAFVEAGYLYGLIIYFVSGDPMRALLFVPIGAVWSAIYWPRDEKIMRTLERLEAP